MTHFRCMKLFATRHAISVGLSVLIAFMVNHYYSFSEEYWIVFMAFLVSQTTKGTPIKQGMIIFIVSMFAIVASSLLIMHVNSYAVTYVLLSTLVIVSSYLTFIKRPQANKTYFLMLLFSITFLIAVLSPIKSSGFMLNRIFDAIIGGFIGMMCALIILPVKLDVEFSEGVLPLLTALNEYSQALTDSLIGSEMQKKNLDKYRLNVINALQANFGMYPEWVYEVGFNRGLRSGFRFFLVNVERISEVYFSIDSLISRKIDPLLLRDLYGHIENVMQKNQELLSILSEYFISKKTGHTQSDFTSDVAELEKALHHVVPDNIDILDVSPSFLLITAFVRDIRDLRGLLLQLVMALPAHNG